MIAILIFMAALVVVSRKYTAADIDILSACSSVLEQVRLRKAIFQVERPRYTDVFLDEFAEMLVKAKEICGGDNVKELRKATREVMRLKTQALSDLLDFRTFLKSDFKENLVRYKEILVELGFHLHYRDARKNQNRLIQMLYAIQQGLTAELRTEIEAAGMNPLLIDRLLEAAQILDKANTLQEVLKKGRPELTQTDIIFLNKVYGIGTSLADDGQRIFKDNTAVFSIFNFNDYVKVSRRKREEEAEAEEENNELPDTGSETDDPETDTTPE